MKNKLKLNGMKRSYFKVPNKLLDVNLPIMSVAIYVYMAKQSEDFNPSIATMAKILDVNKNTIVKYIKVLKDRNIIKLIARGGERTISKYEFVSIDEWINETT